MNSLLLANRSELIVKTIYDVTFEALKAQWDELEKKHADILFTMRENKVFCCEYKS